MEGPSVSAVQYGGSGGCLLGKDIGAGREIGKKGKKSSGGIG